MKKIPSLLWHQYNRGDLPLITTSAQLGTLRGSFNLDLQTNLGKTRTGRMLQTTVQAVDTSLTGPAVGFKYFNSGIYTAAGTSGTGQVHSNAGTPEAAFSGIGTSLKPATCDSEYSDIEIYNNTLYVTSKDKKVWSSSDGSSWTTNDVGSDNLVHMMCIFLDRVYVTQGASIFSWTNPASPATSGAYTIALSNTYVVTWMRATSKSIFIGTINTKKGKAYVYEWDGSSANPTRSYRMEASGVLACVVKDDIPHVLDSNGKLLRFTGGGFEEIARLPLEDKHLINPLSITNNRFIHPNGMAVVNRRINMLINGQYYNSTTSLPEYCPSGVWEYDEQMGLYHKLALANTLSGGSLRDYGQIRVSAVGGLADMKVDSNSATLNGSLLAGATTLTDATTASCGIFTNDTLNTTAKSAIVTTSEITPSDPNAISAEFSKLYLNFRPLKNSGDKIVSKYRITKQDPVEITITATSSTQFTTTSASMANYAVGDEVEITCGDSAGLCAHITAISYSNPTYTVTIDETLLNTSVTAKARLQKWIKMGSFTANTVSSWKDYAFRTATNNTWVQFKIFMLWTGDNQLEALYSVDKPYKPTV